MAVAQRLKLLFMTQTAARPPRFSIQVNSRARITRDYAYFLENRLRERYGLEGVPVIIDFVERNERRRTGAGRHHGGALTDRHRGDADGSADAGNRAASTASAAEPTGRERPAARDRSAASSAPGARGDAGARVRR